MATTSFPYGVSAFSARGPIDRDGAVRVLVAGPGVGAGAEPGMPSQVACEAGDAWRDPDFNAFADHNCRDGGRPAGGMQWRICIRARTDTGDEQQLPSRYKNDKFAGRRFSFLPHLRSS